MCVSHICVLIKSDQTASVFHTRLLILFSQLCFVKTTKPVSEETVPAEMSLNLLTRNNEAFLQASSREKNGKI